MVEASYSHASTPLKTIYGVSNFHCFSFGDHEEDNILCLEIGPLDNKPLVRVQSACYTAEIFRSTDCDCHEQLDTSLKYIHKETGLFVYMIADGRGAGLLPKVRALSMYATSGVDTHDAYIQMGIDIDPRTYDKVALVVRSFGIESLRLLTNNPRKIEGLQGLDFDVEREPLVIPATNDSRAYLDTKRKKFGHLF